MIIMKKLFLIVLLLTCCNKLNSKKHLEMKTEYLLIYDNKESEIIGKVTLTYAKPYLHIDKKCSKIYENSFEKISKFFKEVNNDGYLSRPIQAMPEYNSKGEMISKGGYNVKLIYLEDDNFIQELNSYLKERYDMKIIRIKKASDCNIE